MSVSASRASNTQPDLAVFLVGVDSGLDKGVDEVVAVLQGSGITAANFVGLGVAPTYFQNSNLLGTPRLQWRFQLPAQISKMKDTAAILAALQKKLAQPDSGFSLSFQITAQTSAQAPPACDYAGLLADARAKADVLAGSAGLKAGALLAVSGPAISAGAAAAIPAPCFLSARFALGAMFGQTERDAITITAQQPAAAAPDQVVVELDVTSGLDAGADDIAAALAAAGVSGAQFSGANSAPTYLAGPSQPSAVWSFTLTVPLSKIKTTMPALGAAQQAFAKGGSNLSLSFYVLTVQVSPDQQNAQPCSRTDLLAAAKAQGQKLAAAAGVSVGPILSMADVPAVSVGAAPVGVVRSGDFSSFLLANTLTASYTTSSAACSITVQFALLRN